MRRRDFIRVIGGSATAWPVRAWAQQTAVPEIGYLSAISTSMNQRFTRAFREGLRSTGFTDGYNVAIEFRLVEAGRYDQLPMLAAELVRRGVAVLFASPINAAVAAKSVTASTPIVFAIGSDPVEMKLVSSLNRPGGNVTGATFLSTGLGAKRLELLRELVPGISSIALLVNPNNPTTSLQARDMQAGANALKLRLDIVSARSPADFDDVFATLVQQRTDALVVSADSVFLNNRDRLVALTARRSIPTIYTSREHVDAGGLMSYGSDYTDSFRAAAIYVGRILKGDKTADLPVIQSTKFELVINVRTAKATGFKIPDKILALADEVIE